MIKDFSIDYFKPYGPGIFKNGLNGSPSKNDGYSFAFDVGAYFGLAKDFGIVLYDKDMHEKRIPFNSKGRSGSVYGISLSGPNLTDYTYNFYIDDKVVLDPCGRSFTKPTPFGVYDDKKIKSARILDDEFNWEDDESPNIPYENSFFYGLNVRAFTNHSSSKVKKKGTFEGVIEKLPYIKSLGATAIVLMPSYEFDECAEERELKTKKIEKQSDAVKKAEQEIRKSRVNCWGFIKGNYYAPKALYSSGDDPVKSFKTLVKEAHKLKLEVIMQMYFDREDNTSSVCEILKFWLREYHVDGFRVSGFNIPKDILLKEPVLKGTKLWFDYLNEYELSSLQGKCPIRYASSDNSGFKDCIRKFNKGDEGILNDVICLMKSNPINKAVINYLADYDGFTLKDLYSYERKHNEENGEQNQDGCNMNFSWNCGIEGETRKKNILQLRTSQIKNALIFLMLSAGTPYIFSGDEFGNSRYGNNNAYSLDNEKGYVEWKDNAFSREILSFFKELSKLRFSNEIFHLRDELKNMDVLKCGYPDLSYHGFEAWRPDLSYNSRTIGFLYYGPSQGNKDASSFYVGVNMHWENHRIAMPKLKKNSTVVKLLDTSEGNGVSRDNEIPVLKRSISVYEIKNGSALK